MSERIQRSLLIPDDVYGRVKKLAEKDRRSINQEIVTLLDEAIVQRERSEKVLVEIQKGESRLAGIKVLSAEDLRRGLKRGAGGKRKKAG